MESSKAFDTKAAADTHLALLHTGTSTSRAPTVLLRDYADTWRSQQLHHRPSTRKAVRNRLDKTILPALGDMDLGTVTRTDVQSAVVAWSRELSPSTVHVAYGFVASLFKAAVDDGLVSSSPCVRISLPAVVVEKVIPLTVEQVRILAEAVPDWYRAMVVVGAATGLRSGELRGLTADRVVAGAVRVDRQLVDVDQREPVFGPPKSPAGNRVVPLGDVAGKVLEEHMAVWPPGVGGLLWTTRQRGPVTRGDAGAVWARARKGMGLRRRSGWHDLRHHNASLLIAAGLSPRLVADRLGHEDPAETLRTYSHLWPSDQERATAAIDEALRGL